MALPTYSKEFGPSQDMPGLWLFFKHEDEPHGWSGVLVEIDYEASVIVLNCPMPSSGGLPVYVQRRFKQCSDRVGYFTVHAIKGDEISPGNVYELKDGAFNVPQAK